MARWTIYEDLTSSLDNKTVPPGTALKMLPPSPRARRSHNINGEFDPGSGRTLAACLTHASRANLRVSGERVSNTWATCPELWDNPGKPGLIPDMTPTDIGRCGKIYRLGMGPRPISLLVG